METLIAIQNLWTCLGCKKAFPVGSLFVFELGQLQVEQMKPFVRCASCVDDMSEFIPLPAALNRAGLLAAPAPRYVKSVTMADVPVRAVTVVPQAQPYIPVSVSTRVVSPMEQPARTRRAYKARKGDNGSDESLKEHRVRKGVLREGVSRGGEKATSRRVYAHTREVGRLVHEDTSGSGALSTFALMLQGRINNGEIRATVPDPLDQLADVTDVPVRRYRAPRPVSDTRSYLLHEMIRSSDVRTWHNTQADPPLQGPEGFPKAHLVDWEHWREPDTSRLRKVPVLASCDLVLTPGESVPVCLDGIDEIEDLVLMLLLLQIGPSLYV